MGAPGDILPSAKILVRPYESRYKLSILLRRGSPRPALAVSPGEPAPETYRTTVTPGAYDRIFTNHYPLATSH